MKSKGDIRAIDDLGRVVIPMTFRKLLDIKAGDMLEINMTENSEIVIVKNKPSCVFCASEENLVTYLNKSVCEDCKKKLSEK